MIKPCHWPRIEFLSSGGQESQHLSRSAAFHLGGSSGILQDKVRMLGALVLSSPSKHIFCCSLLTLLCAYVNEWHVLWETSEDPCSVVPWWLHMAYGRNMLLIIPTCQCQETPNLPVRGAARDEWSMWTQLSILGQTFNLFDHFITSWEFDLLT